MKFEMNNMYCLSSAIIYGSVDATLWEITENCAFPGIKANSKIHSIVTEIGGNVKSNKSFIF
jgi:hypothetical protein